ncbi:MAG: Na+/H+ antiporter NhaA [Bacteroidetes bacterium]|nr:Na+/H+ antiporter NhaA [Bacteroidota bacterium]
MNPARLLKDFFESQKAGGIILLLCTALSLALTNSSLHDSYTAIFQMDLAGHEFTHWINDGLMAVFFLLIGLELEREIYRGELSSFKNALLPVIAAIGGMCVPALIHLFFNYGTPTQAGAGIPMATDIAFAIGILSLLGNKVPLSLKIFLTALAVIDDLGAILAIAIFYTDTVSLLYLFSALGIFVVLLLLKRLKVHNLLPYLAGGILMWYCMLHSGVHATISGVLLAFSIPFGDGGEHSPSYKLQHALHKPVAFIILPLFALANTCLVIEPGWAGHLMNANGIGILCGLVIGKPTGIILFCFLAVASGLCRLPGDLHWRYIIGAGFLGGIGFTMSVFISLLAFSDEAIVTVSKMAILISSFIAGMLGYVWLYFSARKNRA